ncbi:MAG TPA: hypothetical protein VIJ92_15265 [Ginsengibacter sp.]
MKQIEIGTLKYEDFQRLLTAMKAAYPLDEPFSSKQIRNIGEMGLMFSVNAFNYDEML